SQKPPSVLCLFWGMLSDSFGRRPVILASLILFLIGFAFMSLFWGMLSDSFGRRPVILASLILFLIDEKITIRRLEVLLAFLEAGTISRAAELRK
ncbi:putative transporter, partial [Alcaligenes faecalis subsp. faecalis NCIB 8687]